MIFTTANGFHIPDRMMRSIEAYIQKGQPVGDFLQAIICNDLREAVVRADDENIRNLPAFVYYFYQNAPSQCWGTRNHYNNWVAQKGLKGE